MRALKHVQLPALDPGRFREVLDEPEYLRFQRQFDFTREQMGSNVVYNVNSTAQGGGVAEMLHTLLPYVRGAGVDARWLVIRGTPEFFVLTKRLHNHLHGVAGDGGPLGEQEHEVYRHALAAAASELVHLVRPGDVVILHDPQTAGLTDAARAMGATVVWRCHVGLDHANEVARHAWAFLESYVRAAHASVFSRRVYAWTGLDDARIAVVHPSIDPFSPKNQELDADAVASILAHTGILDGARTGSARYARQDGSPGRVDHPSELVEDEPLRLDTPLVLQVSRWDRLKDPVGLMEGFAARVAAPVPDVHLMLAGPAVARVADDPEGQAVLEETVARRAALPPEIRRRVHLASLPMINPEENAAIVNALQRHATVVVQKSLVEGFGITVAEAMWKVRPVVASGIGGIQDQIVHGRSGLLVDDPTDLRAFGDTVTTALTDRPLADRLAKGGRERVRRGFLHPRHLLEWARLVERLRDARRR